jgi:hypothetical protein
MRPIADRPLEKGMNLYRTGGMTYLPLEFIADRANLQAVPRAFSN